ncbi:MAG: helix-turn-helix domain-containing protein [Treponema sp.]|jgi:transcriptional regulator with XRE-family HTH domain|nr:helix-turn-helix domain-containing protein [Treponema sp.]
MTVNKRIRQVRQALNMTQTDFSRAIYISNGYTAEIENGHRVANDRIIHLISLVFGVSERWLKTGEGEMFQTSPAEWTERILRLFNELNPRFQEYALSVLDQLVKLQNDQASDLFKGKGDSSRRPDDPGRATDNPGNGEE